MIWIDWLIVIILDAFFNYWKEKEDVKIRHGINGLLRIAAGIIIVARNQPTRLEFYVFAVGAFFWFWLLFGPIHSKLKGLPINHQGKNILDRFERATLPWIVWAIFKTFIAGASIYYFYNPDLFQ